MVKTGTAGDPALATHEKGEALVESSAKRLADLIREFRRREIRPRTDHH